MLSAKSSSLGGEEWGNEVVVGHGAALRMSSA